MKKKFQTNLREPGIMPHNDDDQMYGNEFIHTYQVHTTYIVHTLFVHK